MRTPRKNVLCDPPAVGPGWPLELLGPSAAARRLRDRTRELAQSRRPVLVVAPAGFQVRPVAETLHAMDGRPGPLVAVDTAAEGPETERALFGAPASRRGRADLIETATADSALARARRGTLLLLSVQDLPATAQLRLARVLRDGEVRVNGAAHPVRLDQRVIAASELPLDLEVQAGRFRADLFKRFAARQIALVPLCERREDIAVVASALMVSAPSRWGRPARALTDAALALLGAFRWDRNVAELEALLRELAGQDGHAPIRVEDVVALANPGMIASLGAPWVSLRDARRQFEREYIAAVLRHSEWRMDQAARLLGIQRTNLYRKARQLGIARRSDVE